MGRDFIFYYHPKQEVDKATQSNDHFAKDRQSAQKPSPAYHRNTIR
jgi:hypothetical protein